MNGVVIIAAGHFIYSQMALNLAMGLKHTDSKTNITLLWQGQGRAHIEPYLTIFDQVIEIPSNLTDRNGFQIPIKAKMSMYDMSPYDTTIYLDADIIWFPFKPISQMFEELKDEEFTMANRSKDDLNTEPRLLWVKATELKNVYGDKEVYNLSSEFVYFKKTDSVKRLFDAANSAFDEPKLEFKRFAGSIPDELAFQIAMMETGMKPHKTPYLPMYWEPYEKKNLTVHELYKTEYFGYSVGGNLLSTQQKTIYDGLVKFYSKLFGIKYAFLAVNKREALPTRANI